MDDWKMDGKPALVIIHMQEGIVGKGGVPGQYEEIVKSGSIAREQALLQAFRKKGLPVIYVVTIHASAALSPAARFPAYGGIFRMIESIEPKPNDLIFRQHLCLFR